MTSQSLIESFPTVGKSHRVSWGPFLQGYLLAAAQAYPETPHGLLGFVLSPPAYALHTGDAEPFRPFPPPAQMQYLGNAANYPIWLEGKKDYLSQARALATFTAATIAALDPDARLIAKGADPHLSGVPLTEMINRLRIEYGIPTVAERTLATRSLSVVYAPPLPVRDHIRRHLEVHDFLAQNGEILADASKVRYLSESVQPCGMFRSALELYVAAYPAAAEQTFTRLRHALTNAEDNFTTVTSAGAGYAHLALAATAVHKSSGVEAKLDKLIELLCRSHQPAAAVVATKPPAPRLPRQYCWSHGECAHSSNQCLKMLPGHRTDATAQNRMGGRDLPSKK